MDGEFRVRDALLAGYYLVFMTANFFLLAWTEEEGAAVVGLTVGVLSVIIASLMQVDSMKQARFNRFCFGAFLVLTVAVVAADVLILTW